MNTLPFLANIADVVGVPATKWDAPGIILLKTLSNRFPRLAKRVFHRKRVRYRQGVGERARYADRLQQPAHPVSPTRHRPLRRLSVGNAAGHHLG